MFAAAFIRDRQSAFQILVFFSTPIFMISGFTWPLDQMPRYIQIIAWCFPTTPALHAMRLVSSKTGDMSVIAPYLWLTAALGAFYFLLAALNIRYGAGKH
jgi:ABC-2 type transport system permease protein